MLSDDHLQMMRDQREYLEQTFPCFVGAVDYIEELRAQLAEAERQRDEALAACLGYKLACKNSLKIPRPWMDGGLSYKEWDEAFERIEKVIDSPNPGKPLLDRLHAAETERDGLRVRVVKLGAGMITCDEQCKRAETERDELRERVGKLEGFNKRLLCDFEHILEYWNGSVNETAMIDALYEIERVASKALAAVLNPIEKEQSK